MPRRLALVLPALVAALLIATAPASALSTRACKSMPKFRCGTVTVPLDRSGRVPGTVKLRVAIERPRKGATGFLLALTGGPGQPAVPFASSFRYTLEPALRHRRLVVFDQRGTGSSSLIRCESVQGLRTLDTILTKLVEQCATRQGARRQAFATADSVEDLDAVRAAVGADRLELMGVSYGTYVAAQYARAHPDRTEGLILDSVVAPGGVNPYYLETYTSFPRILREQCARNRCAGATRDPMADLARLTARLRRGPLRGWVVDEHGRRRRTAIHDEGELAFMIMSGDLNPWLQLALPAAIASAVRGDATPLLRLRRPASGPRSAAREFSMGLNVTTACADIRLPYGFAAPFGDRVAAWLHGLDGVPAAAFAPFGRDALLGTSAAHDCLRWPQGDLFATASTAPLPDVPALVLSGRLDTRTPTENARALLPSLPHGQLLTVRGTGHDVLDADFTGCAAVALRRFAAGRSVGTPCRDKSNQLAVEARPPRSLADYRVAPGVPGRRGRVVTAVLDTIVEAQTTALQTLFAGFEPVRAGGLRGGVLINERGVGFRMRRYALVPGVAVTGGLGRSLRFVVDGPGRLDGRLRLRQDFTVTGVLGGVPVRMRPARASGASAANAGDGRAAGRLLSAAEVARAVRAARVPAR